MTKHVPAVFLASVAVLAGCSQPPPQTRNIEGSQARYVDAATLTSGDDYSGVEVLTSVPLRHISAVDAEAGLRRDLPENVLTGRVGQKKAVLLQGPGQEVVEAIRILKKLDVR